MSECMCIWVGVMKRNEKIDFDQLSESIDNALATFVCAFNNKNRENCAFIDEAISIVWFSFEIQWIYIVMGKMVKDKIKGKFLRKIVAKI